MRRGTRRILVRKSSGTRPVRRSRSRWQDNLKMNIQETGWGRGGGTGFFGRGQGQWQGAVNTVTNLRVPQHVRNFCRAEELLAFLGLCFMEFSYRTFSFLLFCKVRNHVSYQCKTKDMRLLLKCFTSSVSGKDLERAQPDLYRIQADPNSNHCGGTPNVAVKCLAHRFEFMNVHFKSRPADPLY